jgi:hypothetical protein
LSAQQLFYQINMLFWFWISLCNQIFKVTISLFYFKLLYFCSKLQRHLKSSAWICSLQTNNNNNVYRQKFTSEKVLFNSLILYRRMWMLSKQIIFKALPSSYQKHYFKTWWFCFKKLSIKKEHERHWNCKSLHKSLASSVKALSTNIISTKKLNQA